jgi:hypothetical protein
MADEPVKPSAATEALKTRGVIEKFIKIEKIEKIEHKEKPEKIEHKEKPEKWEHKEKPEKFEHKEKPEKFEHKEKIEHKEKFEIKELEKLVLEQAPSPEVGGDPEQRIAALERQVAQLTHFITTGQRPDVSQGALANEPPAAKK